MTYCYIFTSISCPHDALHRWKRDANKGGCSVW